MQRATCLKTERTFATLHGVPNSEYRDVLHRTTIQHADGDLAVAITTTFNCPPITLNMTSGFDLSLTRQ